MRILKLEGEFFCQYKKLGPIYFPAKGTIAITGPNGSGKSTLFSAIEVALFGRVPGKIASDLKYNGATKSEKWWVRLTFSLSGNQYTVLRHETTSRASLKMNGKLVQSGQVEVTDYITNSVLKMDQTDFSNAFYARQDEFDSLNKLTNENRKREVSKLLRIDLIDKAISLSRADKNELNTKVEEQKKYIISSEYFKSEREKLSKSINYCKMSVKKDKEEFSKLEQDYENKNKTLKQLEDKYNHFKALNEQRNPKVNELHYLEKDLIPNLKLNINEIQKETAKIPKLKKMIEPLKDTDSKIKILESQKVIFERRKFLKEQLERLKVNLKSQKDEIEKNKKNISNENFDQLITTKRKDLDDLNNKIEEHNKARMNAHSQLHFVKENGKNKRLELNNIQELGTDSSCPLCKRGLGEHHNHLVKSLESEINNLLNVHSEVQAKLNQENETITNIKNEINKITLDIDKLAKERDLNERRKDLLESEQKSFARSKTDYVNIEKEYNSIKEVSFDQKEYDKLIRDRDELTQRNSELYYLTNKAKELTKLKDELSQRLENQNKLTVEVKSLDESIKKLEFDEELYTSLKKETVELMKNLREFERILLQKENELKNLEQTKKKLKEEEEKNREIITSQNKRLEKLKSLIYLDDVFAKYKVESLAKIAPSIALAMQNLLSHLTDGKYDQVELDDDYNIFVYRNGKKQPFHKFSGGEKKLFSLVQRLAISQIILSQNVNHHFDFLALDEVIGSMDEDRKNSITDALNKLNNIFKQILMISHDQDVNDLFDYALIVSQNEDLTSKVEWNYEWNQEEIENEIL